MWRETFIAEGSMNGGKFNFREKIVDHKGGEP